MAPFLPDSFCKKVLWQKHFKIPIENHTFYRGGLKDIIQKVPGEIGQELINKISPINPYCM